MVGAVTGLKVELVCQLQHHSYIPGKMLEEPAMSVHFTRDGGVFLEGAQPLSLHSSQCAPTAVPDYCYMQGDIRPSKKKKKKKQPPPSCHHGSIVVVFFASTPGIEPLFFS